MEKVVLFGAGIFCKNAINIIGKENIAYIVDNDKSKSGSFVEDIPVYFFGEKQEELSKSQIVISVSKTYADSIISQLSNIGITNYLLFGQLQVEYTKRRIEGRYNYLTVYDKCIEWIKKNSIDGECIICNTQKREGYPEVTGYYIPTLIRWGYRDLALKYVDWLLSIQKEDGSWFDVDNKNPYIFDSAQILKGLLAAKVIVQDVSQIDNAIIKGCDWILSNMQEDGRLVTPSQDSWGNDESVCSELVHLYCLSPIREAGIMFNKPEYINAVDRILKYYKEHYYEKILNFGLLSHFYAYVIEALVDLGEIDLAKEAMSRIGRIQRPSGAVPAYNNVDWVCSTGLFQLALIWFRLEDIEKGNRAFEFACKLQNETGGWFGSYLSEINFYETNSYFPSAEISWANKFFLDALYYKNKAEFNQCADIFLPSIQREDERYIVVMEEVAKASEGSCILDVGCGKGRYLRNLISDVEARNYYAVDISDSILKNLNDMNVTCRQGVLTYIPFENDKFAVTYTCEALEHAIDIESSVREMCRVTLPGGKIVIVDKNDGCYGALEIGEWEQWPNEEQLKQIMLSYCSDVQVHHGLRYENMSNEESFTAWIGCVK